MHLGTSEQASTGRQGVVGLGGLLCWTPFSRFNFLALRAAEQKKKTPTKQGDSFDVLLCSRGKGGVIDQIYK